MASRFSSLGFAMLSPSVRDLVELVDASQRDRHLGLEDVARSDLPRLVAGDDAGEGPAEPRRQLDAVLPGRAVAEVLLQGQVPLVLGVEIEGHDDLAGVDDAGELLPDVTGRIKLVDLRHLALGL